MILGAEHAVMSVVTVVMSVVLSVMVPGMVTVTSVVTMMSVVPVVSAVTLANPLGSLQTSVAHVAPVVFEAAGGLSVVLGREAPLVHILRALISSGELGDAALLALLDEADHS